MGFLGGSIVEVTVVRWVEIIRIWNEKNVCFYISLAVVFIKSIRV